MATHGQYVEFPMLYFLGQFLTAAANATTGPLFFHAEHRSCLTTLLFLCVSYHVEEATVMHKHGSKTHVQLTIRALQPCSQLVKPHTHTTPPLQCRSCVLNLSTDLKKRRSKARLPIKCAALVTCGVTVSRSDCCGGLWIKTQRRKLAKSQTRTHNIFSE